MEPALIAFLYGSGGSVAVEVLTALAILEKEQPLPKRYSSWVYYLLRLLVVFMAGALAVAYGVYDKPLLAINIGASAPLILQTLARGIRSR
ncbi:MAG: hypothetical protein ACJ746_29120 [Bryobacteraceae bacterium]